MKGKKLDININLDNIKYNFLKLRKICGGVNNVIPVLKANAYNIGVYSVVKTLLNIDEPQKKYFVFSVSEGIELRLFFPELEKIYIISGIFENDIIFLKKYNLTPVINSYEELELCKKYDINNIVLQFNTGMNRAGIENKEIDKIIKFIEKHNINIDIIMSHLCCSEDKKHKMNTIQIENFKNIIKKFPSEKIRKSLITSAGFLNFKNFLNNFNLFRIGGILVNGNFKGFKNIVSIYSKIYYDNKNLYLPIGIKNGFTKEYGRKENYVIVGNSKIFIKSIEQEKIILNSKNLELIGKKAIILGKGISFNDFSLMSNKIPYHIIARVISNCDIDKNNYFINIDRKRIFDKNYKNKLIYKKNNEELEEFTSVIVEKREILENGFIGYGATESVKVGDKIGTILGGYLDGIPSDINKKNMSVFVENVNKNLIKCRIIGKISMDQTNIRIPKKYYNSIKIGAKVIIFNKNNSIKRFLHNGKTIKELFFYIDKSSRISKN